jgi:bacteriorhodopsin
VAIGLISGVSWATIVYNVTLSWTWIASWLSGALIPTHYKWGFFAFGTFAYFLLSASLLTTGLTTAKRLGITSHYLIVAGWLAFLWLLYPIAYGCDEGNKISVTSGLIFEGVLDVLMIPLLSFVVLGLSTKWDYRTLNVYFTQYGRVAQASEFPEKGKAAEGGDQPAVVVPEQAV